MQLKCVKIIKPIKIRQVRCSVKACSFFTKLAVNFAEPPPVSQISFMILVVNVFVAMFCSSCPQNVTNLSDKTATFSMRKVCVLICKLCASLFRESVLFLHVTGVFVFRAHLTYITW